MPAAGLSKVSLDVLRAAVNDLVAAAMRRSGRRPARPTVTVAAPGVVGEGPAAAPPPPARRCRRRDHRDAAGRSGQPNVRIPASGSREEQPDGLADVRHLRLIEPTPSSASAIVGLPAAEAASGPPVAVGRSILVIVLTAVVRDRPRQMAGVRAPT